MHNSHMIMNITMQNPLLLIIVFFFITIWCDLLYNYFGYWCGLLQHYLVWHMHYYFVPHLYGLVSQYLLHVQCE